MKKVFVLVLCLLLLVGIASIAYATENEEVAPETEESVSIQEETATGEISPEEVAEPETTEEETTEEIALETTLTEEVPADALPEESETEVTALPFSQLLAAAADGEEIVVDGAVIVDDNAEIPEGMTITITAGTLCVPESVTLTNSGCVRVTGGELVVEDGAVLDNEGFIEISENGGLSVSENADYAAGESGVLSLNVCAENAEASIAGIDTSLYEYTMPVYTASEFLAAVSSNVYAFKTICLSDISIIAELGTFSISENVSISFIG